MYGPVHDKYLREGYAVGVVEAGSKYMTVLSSARTSRVIFPTPEAAQPRLDWAKGLNTTFSDEVVIRRVRRTDVPTTFLLQDADPTTL